MEQVYKVVVNVYGTFWYNEKGQYHREGDLPACEWSDGSEYYYINDTLHREGGKPAIMRANAHNSWFINGQEVTEKQAKGLSKKCNVAEKVIEIDGKKFKLVAL